MIDQQDIQYVKSKVPGILLWFILAILVGLLLFTEVWMNTFTSWENMKTENNVRIVR